MRLLKVIFYEAKIFTNANNAERLARFAGRSAFK